MMEAVVIKWILIVWIHGAGTDLEVITDYEREERCEFVAGLIRKQNFLEAMCVPTD